ncbi:hypothetical protein BJ944DRAFT_270810 [Cunninghamella echinulata]|nr:hypothetical protein BJ944DRAFT_270810 [Cunninghamella echinulata]
MDIPSPSDKCELPKHIPIDMGIAPAKQPYEHHTLHTNDQQQQQQENELSHLSRHSLSPEKLGVVGYVKDVAGFVKDAVHDVKQQRQTKKSIHEKEKEDYQHHPQDQEQQHPPTSPQPIPDNHPTQHSTPLADAVTSLFPGIGNSPNHASTSPPCTHAEALRENMMEQINYSKEHRLL